MPVGRIRSQFGDDRHYVGQRSRRNQWALQLRDQGETLGVIAEKIDGGIATMHRITRTRSDSLWSANDSLTC